MLRYKGAAYHSLERYEEAISAFERTRARGPESPIPLAWLALTYADMGRMEEARAAAQEVLKLNPSFSAKGGMNATLNHKDRTKAAAKTQADRMSGNFTSHATGWEGGKSRLKEVSCRFGRVEGQKGSL